MEKFLLELLDVLNDCRGKIDFSHCGTNVRNNWKVNPSDQICFELAFYKGERTIIKTIDKSMDLTGSCFTFFNIYKGYDVKFSKSTHHYINFELQEDALSKEKTRQLNKLSEFLEEGVRLEKEGEIEKLFFEMSSEFLMKKPYYNHRLFLLVQDLVLCVLQQYVSVMPKITHSSKNGHYTLVDDIKYYLGNNYSQKLQLPDIADFIGLTPRYADTLFKKHTGYTIIQYLTKIRIETSKKLLITCNKPITDISLDSGFESSAYFSTVFRKVVGTSPSIYRLNFSPYL